MNRVSTFMATKLRKYKYSGSTSARPEATAVRGDKFSGEQTIEPEPEMDSEGLKADIISSLKTDLSVIIRAELKNALTDDFNFVKNELKEVKVEIANSTAAIRSDMDNMKTAISDMEGGLSTWSGEVTALQATVAELKTELANLREKTDDMEGRMRRCNVRIVGVAEEPGSSSIASVSALLKEVLRLDKDILVDRSHRGLAPRKPNGKPRVIVAKLHYYQDCIDVLRRAREGGPLRYKGDPVAIFPDYTAGVAKARAAFNNVRSLLRGRQEIRYGIIFPARLRISYNGDNKEFLDPEKAMAYVKTIIPSAEIAK